MEQRPKTRVMGEREIRQGSTTWIIVEEVGVFDSLESFKEVMARAVAYRRGFFVALENADS